MMAKNVPRLFQDSKDLVIVEWDTSEWHAEFLIGELQLTRIKKGTETTKVETIGDEIKKARQQK